jgi:hypothetical protein
MESDRLQKDDIDKVDLTSVTNHVPGGTLNDFLEYLKHNGQPHAITAQGTQLWYPDIRGELIRLPIECVEAVNREVVRDLLRHHGTWVVSYLLAGDKNHQANCFSYVCRNPNYKLEELGTNARRDVRRGFRSFEIRLCTWDELAEKGFAAEIDTDTRHGYTKPSSNDLKLMVQRQRKFPFFEIFGAWQGDNLTAWLQVIKIDDWALINMVRSCNASLRLCPNNALLYAATKRLLVDEKRKYLSYGLSGSRTNIDRLSMHKYKIRMGYEALPRHRVFVTHPVLRPLLASHFASWLWEKAASAMPRFVFLLRIAGMSQQISGRDKAPLSWADDES